VRTRRAFRRPRVLAGAVLLAVLAGGPMTGLLGAASAGSATGTGTTCPQRTLVLSAMPVELGPLLAELQRGHTESDGGRTYFVGRLHGHAVVLALTGIGPVNARRTTRQALAHFRCGRAAGIAAVVFSGVAGGGDIGDVTVPARWTTGAGKPTFAVSSRLLSVARGLTRAHVPLQRSAAVGDPACGCATDPDAVRTVRVEHAPRIVVGGTGHTTDPFAGRALACVPGGGDVLGCEPCAVQTAAARQAPAFARSAVPFLDPGFFTGYAAAPKGSGYVAEDEETAAVAAVASRHAVPFLAFRAVSDGAGDPLGLPGFPVQFFFYRQLAADNAAAATLAFLSRYR